MSLNRARWRVLRGKRILSRRHCGMVAAILMVCSFAVPARGQPLSYVTLDYGSAGTFLTGIRGDTLTGQDVIQSSGANGGLIYSNAAASWTPFPEATEDGVNFPGA